MTVMVKEFLSYSSALMETQPSIHSLEIVFFGVVMTHIPDHVLEPYDRGSRISASVNPVAPVHASVLRQQDASAAPAAWVSARHRSPATATCEALGGPGPLGVALARHIPQPGGAREPAALAAAALRPGLASASQARAVGPK